MDELNVRMCHITGTVQGMYDKQLDRGVIKTGVDKKGTKWQIFEIEVSKKDRKTGNWINGKNLKVTLFGGDEDLVIGEPIGLGNCFFEPDNYTDHSGREFRGVGIVAYADKLFVPNSWN